MPKLKASTIFIGLGAFLFFVLITFPFQNLRGNLFGKIYQATRIHIVSEDLYPALLGWPGIGMRNVTVTLPVGSGEMDLSAEKLVVRIGIGGLFPPAPLVSMSLVNLKKGGDAYVRVSQSRARTSASVFLEGVDLKQLAFPGLGEPIPGKLELEGDFVLDTTDLSKSTGQAKLDIAKLKIPPQNLQGIVLPPIQIGPVSAKITMKGGSAEINSFQIGSKDSDIQGSATGDLRLGQTIYASFLNLNLKLQLSESFRQNPQAVTITSLLETYKDAATGNYSMKWGATIQDMASNLFNAIPQKAAP